MFLFLFIDSLFRDFHFPFLIKEKLRERECRKKINYENIERKLKLKNTIDNDYCADFKCKVKDKLDKLVL